MKACYSLIHDYTTNNTMKEIEYMFMGSILIVTQVIGTSIKCSIASITGISNSIHVGGLGGGVWEGLGRIRFSARKAVIKTYQCSEIF